MVFRRMGSLSDTPLAVIFLGARRSAGGELLLHAPCWNLSGCSSVGGSFMHVPCGNLYRRFNGSGVSFTRPSLESVSLFVWLGIFGLCLFLLDIA